MPQNLALMIRTPEWYQGWSTLDEHLSSVYYTACVPPAPVLRVLVQLTCGRRSYIEPDQDKLLKLHINAVLFARSARPPFALMSRRSRMALAPQAKSAGSVLYGSIRGARRRCGPELSLLTAVL
jgi:hypothetical protein